MEEARAHCQRSFPRYNGSHRLSGIGFMTPAAVHQGLAKGPFKQRAHPFNAAFTLYASQCKGNCPQPPESGRVPSAMLALANKGTQ